MLLQFALKNYLSFKEEQFFSMEAGERLRRFKEGNTLNINGSTLLKNILIFGANGSGKSNLLHGLNTMKKMILNPNPVVTEQLPYMNFLLNENQEKPIKFEIEFIFNEYFYNYTFTYNEERFLSEELSYKLSERASYKTYFKRNNEGMILCPEEYIDISKKLRDNTLFLYSLQDINDLHAISVYKWFKHILYFFEGESNLENHFKLLEKQENKEIFLDFLKAADFNIIDIEVQRRNVELPEELREILSTLTQNRPLGKIPNSVLTLRTVYKKYDDVGNVIGKTSLDLGMESAGTRKIIDIALSVIHCKEYNKILVMDEFDDSLHLSISKALIDVFNSSTNSNQFILTTHQLELLNSDLRADQIYLVEKDFKGESEVFSILDFEDLNNYRKSNSKRLKPYMEGRFGAIPIVDKEKLKTINI
ncbi:MAG TPA: ATP-binding protein [Kurthia gibsonii]|nr:ATP-binding protein [Kurthia gibsonii]